MAWLQTVPRGVSWMLIGHVCHRAQGKDHLLFSEGEVEVNTPNVTIYYSPTGHSTAGREVIPCIHVHVTGAVVTERLCAPYF